MTATATDAVLALAALGVWLGTIGFVRLPTATDRLHCVAFVNVTAGVTLTVAAFLADGVSTRSIKIALIGALCVLTGAAGAHVTGRMLRQRSEP